jgi:hypothetical protein
MVRNAPTLAHYRGTAWKEAMLTTEFLPIFNHFQTITTFHMISSHGSELPSTKTHVDLLLNGGSLIAEYHNIFCLHRNVAAARDTLASMRVMDTEPGVHVAMANDATWMDLGKNVALILLLDIEFRDIILPR